MADHPVLIVGGGPTGLVLALSLARRGVRCRIIDEHDGPGRESRAMGVHARTLEFYRQFGFADEVVADGVPADIVHLRRHGRAGVGHEVRTFSLGDMGKGLSPFPYLLTYPQDVHERLLVGKLEALGVAVERSAKLTDFTQDEGGVRAKVAKGDAAETIEASYLVGCDGARSRVRAALRLGFLGGTYEQLFYVADVKIDRGFDRDIYVNLGANSLVIMMPVRVSGMQRLIGLVPGSLDERKAVSFEDFRFEVEPLMGLKVTEVNWFSTYRVHHRVADHFRVGRAFIAGDAGHLHSPAGGQGMNTGIGDAINLGWKLADVVRGRAAATILESYEAERLPFARRLVATTDRAFGAMIADGLNGEIVRNWLVPTVVGIATRLEATKHAAFRTVSQISLSYPDSVLSEGEEGVRGGDRLPWVGDGESDNFDPLRSLDWQVHVYGDTEAGLEDACRRRGLALHTLPWSALVGKKGLKQNAAYLIRPDGHVAIASASNTAGKIDAYAKRMGLKLGDDVMASWRHAEVESEHAWTAPQDRGR